MKVTNYSAIPPAFPTTVRERQDGGGETGGGGYSPQQNGRRSNTPDHSDQASQEQQSANPHSGNSPAGPTEPTPEMIDQAIRRFAEDSDQSKAMLSAEATGFGPGLRIVLKNQSGEVVRQLNGREFVALSENAASGTHRGRLLDKKI